MTTIELELTQGKVTLIDEADLVLVLQHKWHAAKNARIWYARRSWRELTLGHMWMGDLLNNRFLVYDNEIKQEGLHNFLMGEKWIDHINGDGLDNRRSNLRKANHSQNTINTDIVTGRSKYRGVVLSTPAKHTWKAVIRINGKKTHLGSFKTQEEAAKAYDEAAREYHGEFARLNFP